MPNILFAHPKAVVRDEFARHFQQSINQVIRTGRLKDLEQYAQHFKPVLIVSAFKFREGDCLYICRKLRANGERAPIVMLCPDHESHNEAQAEKIPNVSFIVGTQYDEEDPTKIKNLVSFVKQKLREHADTT